MYVPGGNAAMSVVWKSNCSVLVSKKLWDDPEVPNEHKSVLAPVFEQVYVIEGWQRAGSTVNVV